MGEIEGLYDALRQVTHTNPNDTWEEQTMIVLKNGGRPMCAIYSREKIAEFYHEYTQIGCLLEELQPLLDFFNANGYTTNLD